jgi:hypothetical protein
MCFAYSDEAKQSIVFAYMISWVAEAPLPTLETIIECTTSCLFLSKTFALKLAGAFTSFRCHWSLDATVVVYAERGRILLRLSWAFRAELVASDSD